MDSKAQPELNPRVEVEMRKNGTIKLVIHYGGSCKKGRRVYISRPSRTQQLKNPKLRMKPSIDDLDDDGDDEKPDAANGKEEGERRSKKSKRKHMSKSDSGSDFESHNLQLLHLEDMIGVRSHHIGGAWEGGDQQNVSYGHHQAQSQGLFQSLECDPTLQMGYNHPVCSEQMAVTTQGQSQPGNGYIPGWML